MTALRVMGIACAVSLCLLGAEWHYLSGSVAAPADTPAPSVPPARAVLAPPVVAPPPADLDGLIRIVLERPLFSKTRRPALVEDSPVAAKDPALPRLSGIVVLPSLRRAIFQSPGADRQVVTVVGEAGRIDSWTVESIDSDGVTLIRGSETMLLTPAFAALETALASRPSRPLSRWEAPADHGVLRARWSNPHLQPRERARDNPARFRFSRSPAPDRSPRWPRPHGAGRRSGARVRPR
jgi:hypothetical protein